MHKVLCDTCIWENLAKDPQHRPLLNVIFELESSGDLGLIVPRIVIEEFDRRKERISKENTQSVSSLLKRIKAIVGKHGDGDRKAIALEQLNLVDSKLPRLGDAVETAVSNIETLLQRGEIVETNDSIMLRAARRALEKKAPFIREKNMADAIIIEAFADCVKAKGHRFAFVTDNVNDFSDRKVNDKHPHPDIASIFNKRNARYFITLADALRWIDPDAVAEYSFDFTNQPRRTDEILDALDLLWHQIWYNRHKNWMYRIEHGLEPPGDPKILKTAKAAARRVERKYGKKNLGPWDDFEWGMLNGKMSALNWVFGEEWDFLDT
jgi:PIN domain